MKEEKIAIMRKTGQRLRYLRISKGLSQEELALSAETTPAYIGQIERGTKCPTVDTLNRICAVLNVTLSDFFDFDTEANVTDNSGAMEKISRNISRLSKKDADRIAQITVDIIRLFCEEKE